MHIKLPALFISLFLLSGLDVSPASANMCALDHSNTSCWSRCMIFEYAKNPAFLPSNSYKSYSGKDLKEWTDSDIETFKSDFLSCHKGDILVDQVPDGEFPAYIDRMADYVKKQRGPSQTTQIDDPTLSYLKACPAFMKDRETLQSRIDALHVKNINVSTEEGLKNACDVSQRMAKMFANSVSELNDCKGNGVVGLQSTIQQLQMASDQGTRMYHQLGCD